MLARRLLPLAALLGALGVVYASVPTTPIGSGGSKFLSLLPSTGQTAQVMRAGAKLTIVDLQQRVMSVGGSREALQEVMASVAQGQIPAYDPRLGISKEEFSKYLVFQTVPVATGKTVKFAVTRDAYRVTFSDAPVNGLLRGLSFDLKTGELRVPEGFIVKPVVVSASTAPDRSIDLRGGLQWNLRGYNAEAQNGINGQLSLFQVGDNQVLFIYKRVSSLIHGTFNNTSSEIMLKYTR